jgi:type IV pilus assembly protein PilV
MRRKPVFTAPRRRAGGATLIEVLVSVVVVAIGLLGAAALLSSALRNNQASYERSQTTVLGQAMLDAMRANLAGVDAGSYQNTSYLCAAPSGSGLANADVVRWIGDLQAQLNASACGKINCAGRQCTVSIRWDDARGSGGSSAFEYIIVSRL